MSILDFFSGEPRPQQTQILEILEENWSKYDVFVVQAPVATGKSRIAKAVVDWQNAQNKSAIILTHTNQLVKQYEKEFTDLTTMKQHRFYKTKRHFMIGLSVFKRSMKCIANYYMYLAHRAYKDVLIVDEAHNMLGMLCDSANIKLWQHLYKWPDDLHTKADVLSWLEEVYPDKEYKTDKVAYVKNILREAKTKFIIELTTEEYRGKNRRVLKLTPLDARAAKPIMWPAKVKKTVLMSATINEHDIYDMGLDTKRVLYIPCDSPIAHYNRPVIYKPVANVSYKHMEQAVDRIAVAINRLLSDHKSCGVIHCTYSLAKMLESRLDNPRLMWHNKIDKSAVYNAFIDSPVEEGKVLIASGMYEGLDLSYDLARWQVICKVPYTSLAEPVVRARLEQRPDSYAWWAIRSIVQATGRVCRTPTDYGWTYILDNNFDRLYKNNQDLFPEWFKSAVRYS